MRGRRRGGKEGGREEGREGGRRGWEGGKEIAYRSTCKHGTSNDLVARLLKMSFQEICKT